ncbi:MAG: kynureninase [Saprospiraceae bacterium]|nr:kynureninase [Saprospiraceae bacterium]
MADFSPTLEFARELDRQDPLRSYREQFHFPQHQGSDVLYFCGNSLGLQPKGVKDALLQELEHWQTYGVEGHFRGEMPWMYYHKFLSAQTARLVGAQEEEVVVMNTLTTNLHLMMVSFYRPTSDRYKIVMEAGAFPSDQYAVESQVRFHGFAPEEAIVEVAPREGEETLRTEDIIETIERQGAQTALVLFAGVNYYTGQFFDLPEIAAAGRRVGARVGFDLAHAAGNLPLQLHDSKADFAVWCSYKYLNSGPGGPSGVFVHERHAHAPELPRFAGWWGHDESQRFFMRKGFVPMRGAAGWQLSNAQIFSFAAHKASLDLFDEVGMPALREKSLLLTGYLEFLLQELNRAQPRYRVITPTDPAARGCQLSILTGSDGKELFDHLSANGAVCDWREPNVIRVAPVPLYNSFEDVWRLAELLR